MKKMFFALLVGLAVFASCEKDPDLDKVQDQYMVYTQYDKNVNFTTYKSFYIPDSVLLISNTDTAKYIKSSESNVAKQILTTYKNDMISRGYTATTSKDSADLGLQISFLENTQYYTNWWDYPYYWGPDYWWSGWNGYGWYYPYAVVYSFTTGSILGELVDLKATDTTKAGSTTTKPTIIWLSAISGFMYNFNSIDLNQATADINQAFSQSSYLKAK